VAEAVEHLPQTQSPEFKPQNQQERERERERDREREESGHVQHRCNFFSNLFDLQLIESANAEPLDTWLF
jgi:hypothetical protein